MSLKSTCHLNQVFKFKDQSKPKLFKVDKPCRHFQNEFLRIEKGNQQR